MFLLGIVILILGLILSVALHELGHLLPAKRFGALVPEYWIGFGPTLFSRRVGDTVYGLKAVLLGGYVRIVGMFPPSTVKVASVRPDRGLVAQARLQSAEDIAAAKDDGLEGTPFYQLKTPQKLVIMFGGPIMNLLLAFLFTIIAVVGIGWAVPSTTVGEVLPTTSDLNVDGSFGEENVESPAASAGMQAGDKILAWNGETVDGWEELVALMEQTPDDGAPVLVERGGSTEELFVAPIETEAGKKVGITSKLERSRGNLADSAALTGQMFTGTAAAIWHLPQSLWNLMANLGSDSPRDPEGAVSVVGVARLAGEVTAVEGPGVSGADRAMMLLSLLASLNMALFVFNLIPLPPLDGGHIAGAAWAGVKNVRARLLGKPKPAPVDTARMVPLSYAVFAVLIGISVLLMLADLVKPLQW